MDSSEEQGSKSPLSIIEEASNENSSFRDFSFGNVSMQHIPETGPKVCLEPKSKEISQSLENVPLRKESEGFMIKHVSFSP